MLYTPPVSTTIVTFCCKLLIFLRTAWPTSCLDGTLCVSWRIFPLLKGLTIPGLTHPFSPTCPRGYPCTFCIQYLLLNHASEMSFELLTSRRVQADRLRGEGVTDTAGVLPCQKIPQVVCCIWPHLMGKVSRRSEGRTDENVRLQPFDQNWLISPGQRFSWGKTFYGRAEVDGEITHLWLSAQACKSYSCMATCSCTGALTF